MALSRSCENSYFWCKRSGDHNLCPYLYDITTGIVKVILEDGSLTRIEPN